VIRPATALDLEQVVRTQQGNSHPIVRRSDTMYLINEALARAHIDERHEEARNASQAIRIVRARRAQRRAAEAIIRSRRAAAHVH
jgi:hypothetical protein